MRILLAEDDAETAAYVVRGLSGEGHVVDHLTDGREALSQAMSAGYDLLILDRMMPGLDGLSVLKSLRAARIDAPAILLTAMGAVDDKVAGLRSGADDYMVKPFAFVELLARIDTICRRPATRDEVVELVIGELRLDLLTREAARDGQRVDLQPREFLLLKHFMERPGRVQTRTVLLESVWGLQFDPKTSVVETHISRLRNKIDKPFDKHYLVTLHGVGYVLQP
ncbi:MAG: response regulator transcription factor [Paracoccus sp. (in: a-proteobacteria)]|jgi:two-component system OmpR family response regulator|uniref:response regulator transcription factor n=1 Tax=unclassified Paracoccus (in: a-proteobacteria) TaxID=2688777 RepID=UPI000C3C3AAE|nr:MULTISPECIES: response regulator transcription factor [unclassified Paracoccus (in: a-proteobacteria)]MAN56757.1 DNA-binding response regulator [Paracoccus sp. (in: a-proteobacteria)]MBA48216.1 DNA-binding response regulator [Paracoccus sp. (in: a-proteobacteria)]MDB2552886.1 response regulator transcription factor [Paracoccus sp. (in: a-proteobacteria)]HIC67764.1 response regulator transcription factor [Paracoccus sp. (in: a-proteobacteria)]|tara:strand:- start:2724 stop:3395 length:672 start_codon:yes stop_codon:yes gene_type:complete